MWYRVAQNNMTYRWQTTPKGESMFISSGLTKGYKTQPNIRIYFKGAEKFNSPGFFYKNIQQKLSPDQISGVFQQVQDVLAKYPPGFLSERLGPKFEISVVAKIIDKDLEPGWSTNGTYKEDGTLQVDLESINIALDHEIGHALDKTRLLNLKKGLPIEIGRAHV